MDTARFDTATKTLATSTTRRRAIVGPGALALGGVTALGISHSASADARHQCIERCVDRGPDNQNKRQRRDRCRRECENR
jgi:hypothetical protein